MHNQWIITMFILLWHRKYTITLKLNTIRYPLIYLALLLGNLLQNPFQKKKLFTLACGHLVMGLSIVLSIYMIPSALTMMNVTFVLFHFLLSFGLFFSFKSQDFLYDGVQVSQIFASPIILMDIVWSMLWGALFNSTMAGADVQTQWISYQGCAAFLALSLYLMSFVGETLNKQEFNSIALAHMILAGISMYTGSLNKLETIAHAGIALILFSYTTEEEDIVEYAAKKEVSLVPVEEEVVVKEFVIEKPAKPISTIIVEEEIISYA
jgi:hypothetical protein